MWLTQRRSACQHMRAGQPAWRAWYESVGTGCDDALQVRAVVEGRASAWQKHLTLTPTKPGASEAVRPYHIYCSLVCMCPCHRWESHMPVGLQQHGTALHAAEFMWWRALLSV